MENKLLALRPLLPPSIIIFATEMIIYSMRSVFFFCFVSLFFVLVNVLYTELRLNGKEFSSFFASACVCSVIFAIAID